MAVKIAFFNSINSENTGRKLTKFGKKSTEPSSVHKELSYGEKIVKIGPGYPEIFDKIRQFLPRESYAKRGICRRRVSVCVCVSVCLSHSGIVSKRLNVESRK